MILITGGTGQSGSFIVNQLAAARAAFKMLVRDPAKSAAKAPKGVQLVQGNFENVKSLEAAMAGCDHALFNSDGNPKLVEQQRNFVAAAKKAGISHIIRFSVMGASPTSPLSFLRWHGEAEEELKKSGIPFTMLQPTFFMQNLLGSAATIKSQRKIYMPTGDGKAAYVDLADIAAVAVKTLLDPGHMGKSYPITGPRDISFYDIAAAISAAIGKPVEYVNVPPEAARQNMLAAGLERWRVDGILELMAATRNGQMTGISDSVQQITGHAPKSIEQWADENAAAFK